MCFGTCIIIIEHAQQVLFHSDQYFEKTFFSDAKLGNVLPLMLDQFKSVWVLRREISIDEGTIPFKGMF